MRGVNGNSALTATALERQERFKYNCAVTATTL
jgi:hypothetical protein